MLPRIVFRRLLHLCIFHHSLCHHGTHHSLYHHGTHHSLCHHGTHREEEKKQAKKEARGGGVLSFDFEGDEGEEEEEGGGGKEKKQSDKESKGFVQWHDQLLHLLPFLFSLPCYPPPLPPFLFVFTLLGPLPSSPSLFSPLSIPLPQPHLLHPRRRR